MGILLCNVFCTYQLTISWVGWSTTCHGDSALCGVFWPPLRPALFDRGGALLLGSLCWNLLLSFFGPEALFWAQNAVIPVLWYSPHQNWVLFKFCFICSVGNMQQLTTEHHLAEVNWGAFKVLFDWAKHSHSVDGFPHPWVIIWNWSNVWEEL